MTDLDWTWAAQIQAIWDGVPPTGRGKGDFDDENKWHWNFQRVKRQIITYGNMDSH